MKELYLRCALIEIPNDGDEMWDSFYDWCIHNHTYGNSRRELLVGLEGRGFRNAKYICLVDGEIATLLSDEDVERLRYASQETTQ